MRNCITFLGLNERLRTKEMVHSWFQRDQVAHLGETTNQPEPQQIYSLSHEKIRGTDTNFTHSTWMNFIYMTPHITLFSMRGRTSSRAVSNQSTRRTPASASLRHRNTQPQDTLAGTELQRLGPGASGLPTVYRGRGRSIEGSWAGRCSICRRACLTRCPRLHTLPSLRCSPCRIWKI